MTRLTSTLLLTIAACTFTAVPAMAQSSYGGGSNTYRNQPSQASQNAKALKKAEKEAAKQAKAMKKKEMAEKELMMKEKAMMKEDVMMKGEDMAPKATTYGSGAMSSKMKPMKDSMKDSTKSHGSANTYGSAATPATMAKPTNCPANTEPQSNGTCMLKSGF